MRVNSVAVILQVVGGNSRRRFFVRIFFNYAAHHIGDGAEFIVADENRVVAIVEHSLKHVLLESQFAYHIFLDCAFRHKVDNLNVALLAEAINAAYTLFEHGRIPWQVEVHNQRCRL